MITGHFTIVAGINHWHVQSVALCNASL